MNKLRNFTIIIVSSAFAMVSCLKAEKFVQEVFVYEPHGTMMSISDLKNLPTDRQIKEDIYIQGIVTSSDAFGNYSRKLYFQDSSSGISIIADIGASYQLFPIGQKVSVQCQDMYLADVNGVLSLSSGVTGSGIGKIAEPISNRKIRNSMFPVEGGSIVAPAELTLSQLKDGRYADQLVQVQEVFFQTSKLPYANEGGSSEQYRTLYDLSGASALLCTSDGSNMAGKNLPEGKGTITGILTYPGGNPVIMMRSEDDIDFHPSGEVIIDDPDDHKSDVMITEYYSNDGAYYIEVFNVGRTDVNLAEYSLRSDSQSDGNFINRVDLDNKVLGPFGMAVYSNAAARSRLGFDSVAWDPCRTNYSDIDIEGLKLDGNCQIALFHNEDRADILAGTGKGGWASDKTLIRRPDICGHSKASDYTRADAGWITKVAGYRYNAGVHRYFDTDPDFDVPSTSVQKTILEIKSMFTGLVTNAINVTGVVTSDSEGGNVASNCVFIQDNSNRGIKILFKEGQKHGYSIGDEINVELYGAVYEDFNGLLQIRECFVSRSHRTDTPKTSIEPVIASISQISSLQSMYISISGVQAETPGGKYNDEGTRMQDLFDNSFFVKALPGSSLASLNVAEGSGVICGIASVEGDRLVLLPRNAEDVSLMTGSRFKPIKAEEISVAELKKRAAGTISDDIRVTVTVTSDNSEGNMPGNVIFVQDNTGAFRLNLPGDKSYEFGQPLIIVLNGADVNKTDGFVVTPSEMADVVAIGSPDPSLQPELISPNQLDTYLDRLVTVSDVEVDESCRLKKFEGTLVFNTKNGKQLNVKTASTATWTGAYVPTAKGLITGLLCKESGAYTLYPRKYSDLQALPESGTRLNGEKVVYFVPSTDPKADLFISETVLGEVDANGNALTSTARNKCNSKFVELFNPTAQDIDLHNYRVACIKYNNSVARGSINYVRFDEGLRLTPGRTVVFKYLSTALGTGNTSKMTNTIWPAGYTGDQGITSGVTTVTDAVPGVILILEAQDYSKTVANSVAAFTSFDGNDILVVQKTDDGGSTWKEIDRVFVLTTSTGAFGNTKAVYPFLQGYVRKPGVLGVTGNITDVQDAGYTTLENKQNHNDFDSLQCSPASASGAPNWTGTGLSYLEDLGVHTFSIK